MRYEEMDPPAALDHVIEAFWHFVMEDSDPPAVVHPIVPDGAVSLAGAFWNGTLAGVEIVGPSQTAQQARLVHGMHVLGARLRPGACRLLLGVAPARLLGQMTPLLPDHWAVALFGTGIDGLASGLAERVAGHEGPDPRVAAAARLLDAGMTVSRVAAALDLGQRQLHRRFTHATGLAPKTWQRVRRQRMAWINHVMGEADSMTETAHSAGFADSAHFSRDARRAFRLPAHQVAAYLATIRHGPLRRC